MIFLEPRVGSAMDPVVEENVRRLFRNQALLAADEFHIREDHMPAQNLRNPAANPPVSTVLSNGLTEVEVFANSKQSFGHWDYKEDYVAGTDIGVHIHWAPSSTDLGVCAWGLDYLVANKGESIDTAGLSSSLMAQAGRGLLDGHQISGFVVVDGRGVSHDSVLFFRLYREAVDAFTGDGQLITTDVYYLAKRSRIQEKDFVIQ